MCGILGIYNLDGAPVHSGLVKEMSQTFAHRGPDGEGYYMDGGLALAHRRLAILDLSPRGDQPMSSKSGVWTLVVNGCIYNFMELKQDLQTRGHQFHSRSDTEVLVEGFDEYGPDFVKKLNGMFAFAAWNNQEKALYLCRDRYGIKPLYYWFNGKTLVFASEIKVILKHPQYSMDVDFRALNEYFTFQNLFSYRTLFSGVTLLPPANLVRMDASSKSVKHNSWWDYDFSQPDNSMTFEDAQEETKRLFTQAVTRQLVADVPVGSYLSGGMDSGSIVAIASRHLPRLTTFTCGFDMNTATGVEANYDERRAAELMASYYKTEHYEQVINSGDLGWSLPKLVWHLEDLRVGMSYSNYYISRLASKFVKVCLTGAGGDELFGGYPWRYYRVFQSLNQEDFLESYYQFWQRLIPDSEKTSLFTDNVLNNINIEEPRQIFERVFRFNDKLKYDTAEEHIQNSLYFEIKTFLHALFIVGDKLAMANGLEERVPFMDNDLVDFAQKIPIRHKLENLEEMKRINENIPRKKRTYWESNDGKNILRQAMADFIPEEVRNRKKQGFSSPDESWYRGENAKYVSDFLLDKNLRMYEFLNRSYVSSVIDEHMNQGVNHRLIIWSFLCFEWWCRKFLE